VAAAARWSRFAALLPAPCHEGVVIRAGRGEIILASREKLIELLGDTPAPPALAGYRLGCDDADAFAKRCSAAGLAVRKNAAGYAVALPPALGGAWVLT
jgi:hypothetical protein